jgi:hypothetical protein
LWTAAFVLSSVVCGVINGFWLFAAGKADSVLPFFALNSVD